MNITKSRVEKLEKTIANAKNPRKKRPLLESFYCKLLKCYMELEVSVLFSTIKLLHENGFRKHAKKIRFNFLVKSYFEKKAILTVNSYQSNVAADNLYCRITKEPFFVDEDYYKVALNFDGQGMNYLLRGQLDLKLWVWIMRLNPDPQNYAHLFIKQVKRECYKRGLFGILDKIN